MNFSANIADLFADVQAEENGNSNGAQYGPQPAEGKPQDRQGERKFLALPDLTFDRRLQQRAELYDYDYINKKLRVKIQEMNLDAEEKAQPIKVFAAIEVWLVGNVYYVVDGFQRAETYRLEGLHAIEADVYRGTFYEARARSFVVNQHGKALTDKDLDHKLNAALEFYQDDLMNGRMSLNVFANRTNLSVAFASNALTRMGIELPREVMVTRTRTNKDGDKVTSTYQMKTGKIGRPKKEKAEDEDDGDADEEIKGNKTARARVSGGRGAEVIQGYTQTDFVNAGLDLGEEVYSKEDDVRDDTDSGEGLPLEGLPSSIKIPTQSVQERRNGSGTEMVLYVPVWAVDALRELILTYGDVRLQEAFQGQLL